jgi:hypothetical protein
MGALSEFNNKSGKDIRNLTLEALKKKSPELFEEGIEKYKEWINSSDPAQQKLGLEIWKVLMNKALPNQTKHEITQEMTVDPKYIEWKERQAQKRIEMQEAEYKVVDDD